jgi:SAM-dependent methyltransferase
MEIVRGRWVLEAGCGAGRFTEVLLDSGAHVFACDLSSAVEANAANFHGREHHFVCQGDIYSLPVAESSFEVVICLGVLQHTPYPETAIESLAKAVKPGGMLVIDHYSPAYHQPLQRRLLRALLLSLPQRLHTPLALGLGHSILPLHRMLWHRPRYHRIWSRLRTLLHRFSPLVDYHASYPELDERILAEWCILDTHDTLTDRYKHLRDADAIRHALSNSGLEVLSCADGGNGIEARAVRRL